MFNLDKCVLLDRSSCSCQSRYCFHERQTALVNVKVIEFKSDQSRRSLAFTDAERATKCQINKRERGKMFSQLFYERNVK